MFAPIGYVSYCQVYDDIESIASKFEWRAAIPFFETDLCKGRTEKSFEARIVLREWLLSHCLIQTPYQMYLCSPSGAVVSIDRRIADAMDHYSLYKFDWPPEPGGIVYKALQKAEGGAQMVSDRFENFFIQPVTWTVRAKIPKYLKALSSVVYSAAHIQRVIEPFSDWSICIAKEDHVSLLRHLNSLLPKSVTSISEWNKEVDASERASTPTRRAAAIDFLERYGDSADAVTLSEAAKTLGYDRKTLRLALAEANIVLNGNRSAGDN